MRVSQGRTTGGNWRKRKKRESDVTVFQIRDVLGKFLLKIVLSSFT